MAGSTYRLTVVLAISSAVLSRAADQCHAESKAVSQHKATSLLQLASGTGTSESFDPRSVLQRMASTVVGEPAAPAAPATPAQGTAEVPSERQQNQPQAASAQLAQQEAQAAPAVSEVPAAQIAPFGREDTARELQKHAARTQDTLIDAVENAEVAEIKRSVFRALTRLRAAEIKEFDTIARLETQAIDEYNDAHHYRGENPLDYMSANEPNVSSDKYTSFHG